MSALPAIDPVHASAAAAIARAAAATGIGFGYLYSQARIESGLDPAAQATTSSARGLYQFVEQSWLATVAQHGGEHGLGWAAAQIERGSDGRYRIADAAARAAVLDLRNDAQAAASMAAASAADNRDYLSARLGREAEPVDLYLAHFLGAGRGGQVPVERPAGRGRGAVPGRRARQPQRLLRIRWHGAVARRNPRALRREVRHRQHRPAAAALCRRRGASRRRAARRTRAPRLSDARVAGGRVARHEPDRGAQAYVRLAIGDALVAQVPALLLSIAAAAVVTRVSSPLDLAGQVSSQFGKANAWTPVAAILGVLAILPGMPHLIVAPAAIAAGYAAWTLRKRAAAAAVIALPSPPSPSHAIMWSDLQDGAALTLDIGYALIGLIDDRRAAPLMARITAIRRQLSRELGFVVPPVRVRDDMSLTPHAYRIGVAGVIVGEDEAFADDFLALDAGDVETAIAGRAVRDPTFGLDAVWVAPDQRSAAIAAGYTVVDGATVIATHLNRAVQTHAADLFGLDEAQALIDALKDAAPELAKGLTPAPFTLPAIAGVARALLTEGVPLKDFRRIALAMVEHAALAATPRALIEAVRQRIGALIVQAIVPARLPLPAVTLEPGLEMLMAQAVLAAPDADHPIEPALGNRIAQGVRDAARPLLAAARPFAVVTGPAARPALARLLRGVLPETPVLSFLEIPDAQPVDVVAVVGAPVEGGAPQLAGATP